MAKSIPQTAPVVIVDGGIIGVSTLYHLAKRGVNAVLIAGKMFPLRAQLTPFYDPKGEIMRG
ncbi:hypothetical protein KO498_15175 [Lentibacter algarum]|uniref:hypothetical protein n=1 Tax=Lentibacter algarum TaxID=576131 RepID=UPI001C098BB4|nr:hypothetical protein [Lentibacter algarum]MBU2983150.1 hypothetical protein [Lentibacter algarum]